MDSAHRKTNLIITAIEIIDDLGYQGLTIHELGKRQNISDAAIYKHFKDKNDLVKSVLDYYNDFFNKITQSIESENTSSIKAIEKFISEYLKLYMEHPHMAGILNSFDPFRHEKDLSKYISDMFLRRVTYLKKLIQRGIDNNEFTRQVDAESLAYVMMGTMMSVTLSWRMQNYSFSLTDKIQLITAQIGNVLTS
ncbi:TetR/AcrR family transcriptional regulator [Thermocaproicibacter melissae]|jgi:AcrR family transcriptional regulator|uniref:TetR/AcrR family transcriptional regulator n=1 Tax=Thermocaproicibacter melissae TaxID=2966552 RepID=UPI0024B24854|nr:TetR/AcrR family transcriptional regulator [Thermocaproicibacter melissae]WBY65096.1 TetR/AcrR family transcriptional regulator [Thermocaproicibacter melissae]